MIIRILGEGQYGVADNRIEELNALDDRLLAANEADDAARFAAALGAIVTAVHRLGEPLASETIVASDLVLPAEDTGLDQVRALLSGEDPIPGYP